MQGVEKCCTDIIELRKDHDSLEARFDEYAEGAQRWRDQHNQSNNEALDRVGKRVEKLEDSIDRGFNTINERLTTFVNPVLAVVISVLTAIAGLLGGALWSALK